MMKKPLYVEFVGLSGAGKSTIAKELIHDLRKEGYRVSTLLELTKEFFAYNKFQKYGYLTLTIFSNPESVRLAVFLPICFIRFRPRTRLELHAYWWIVKYSFVKLFFLKGKKVNIFIHEGEMHLLLLLNLALRSRKTVESLLDVLLAGDAMRMFVSVKMPFETVLSRAQSDYDNFQMRPRFFREGADKEKAREAYEQMEKSRQLLTEVLIQRTACKVVEVSGMKLPKENSDRIKRIIEAEFLDKEI